MDHGILYQPNERRQMDGVWNISAASAVSKTLGDKDKYVATAESIDNNNHTNNNKSIESILYFRLLEYRIFNIEKTYKSSCVL